VTRALLLPLTVAALLTTGGLAAGEGAVEHSANLDGDAALERIVPQEVCEAQDGRTHLPAPTCGADEFPRHAVEIVDTCQGRPYVRRISSVQDIVDRLRIVNADGATNRPEIFFDMRSGATGRGGDIRLVRYDPVPGRPCWKPHRLFRYPTRATVGRIPRGAAGHDGFSAQLGNFSRRFDGLEVRVIETYVDSDDAFCCPSFRRVSLFRFRSGPNRYGRYRTRVTRIKTR
jgi:hypothetical protein